MTHFRTMLAAFVAISWIAASVADAACPCGRCCEPAYTLVERTIMVPHYEQQKRTIQVTECKPVARQREVTVYRCVPEVKKVEQTCTVMTHEPRTRTEHYTVCNTTYREETRSYTVGVPEMQQRTGTRMVCVPKPVTVMKAVCQDHGHWEVLPCNCGCCQPHRVWVPQMVTTHVPCTVMKPDYVEEPYSYSVCVMRPVTKTCKVRVPEYNYETKTRQVTCMVPVPKQVTRMVDVVTYNHVPEKKTEHYTEMVPYTVDKEIYVPVCKMVPKKIVCKVPVPCSVCGH
ncbi:MAG: hypothetical protein RIC55_29965 [Pirellulaceae bacterium]